MTIEVTVLEQDINIYSSGDDTIFVTTEIATPQQAAIQFQEEGVNIGTAGTVDKVNFIGSAVTAARTGNTINVTVAPIITESIVFACSDETSAIAAAAGKVTFRMPYAFTVTAVRASLTTAQASGNIFTVDINESGTSILSTKLTIDNTEKTSTTAATPAVISDSSLADDSEITIDVDQIGNGSAAGLKVEIIGHQ